MYHSRSFVRSARRVAVMALAGIGIAAGSASAQDPFKCRSTISKALAGYESAVVKALNKCEIGVLTGKLSGPCTATVGDAKTVATVAKAKSKLEAAISKKCAGLGFAEMGWAQCPGTCAATFTATSPRSGLCLAGSEAAGNCTTNADCPADDPNDPDETCLPQPVLPVPADESEIADCIACNANASIESLLATAYDDLTPSSGDKDLNKCQQEIGKQVTKLFATISKENAKCAATRPATGGTCPGVKAQAKIAKALAKAEVAILDKKCSGFSAAQIGLPATCPSLETYGLFTDDCGGIATGTVAGYLDCIGCVSQLSAYHEFAGSCGNGFVDFELGETCDDGNANDGDGCPSDCRVSECNVDPKGKTQDIVVDFQAPVGADVMGVEIFVAYPERAVALPGSGNVSDSVTNTPASAAVTVVDTNAGLSIVAIDDDASDPLPTGTLLRGTFNLCVGQAKNQPKLTAVWEGTKVRKAKADNFVCVVDSAVDTNLAPVEGVTCSVSFVK